MLIKSAMTDEDAYAEAFQETKANGPNIGLWAKSFAEANGDKAQAEAIYLRRRAEQILSARRSENRSKRERLAWLRTIHLKISPHARKIYWVFIALWAIVILARGL